MNVTEITTAEAQQEENQDEQPDDRLQAMNTRFETMEKHIKSLADLVGSLVDNNNTVNVSMMMKTMKRGDERLEHMLSAKISPSHQRDTR